MPHGRKLRVALFGTNGHQIQHALGSHPDAHLVATAGIPDEAMPAHVRTSLDYDRCDALEDLIARPDVDLIVLCSPMRRDQHEHAIMCLHGGKHVYAEKPSALHEKDLDRLIAEATESGLVYREMAGTAFEQPYLEMRNQIKAGVLGTVRQVVAQKSYPLRGDRPRGDLVDGGIVRQVGVHAARFVEHVAGVRIAEIRCHTTTPDDLTLAASLEMSLESGGCATIALNYLNPPNFETWGNEMVRVYGDKGFCEITDGGTRSRLMTHDADRGPLKPSGPSIPYHDLVFRHIRTGEPMPFTLKEELHPTRMVIRAAGNATPA